MKSGAVLNLLILALISSARIRADSYTFATIDAPYQGVFQTLASGINDSGVISGLYYSASTDLIPQGFLLDHGVFSTYSDVGFNGINNQSEVVGSRSGGAGFLFRNGNFSTISVPGSMQTSPSGINNSGQIVGFTIISTEFASFLLSGGNYSVFNIGGSASGINDSGQIVGTHGVDGYLLNDGISSIIHFPGAPTTSLSGINDHGIIVGSYQDPSNPVVSHGLVLDQQGLSTFDVPGSSSTGLTGINDEGDIIGSYTDPTGAVHGFLATPVPEPKPRLLVICGSFAAALVIRHRQARTAKQGSGA